MAFEEMREYLAGLKIDSKDKGYVLNYCKKLSYLDGLQQKAYSDTHEEVTAGYGCVNSKICCIFDSYNTYSSVKQTVTAKLNEFGVDIWQVYLTFINKTVSEYPLKLDYLAYELHAVSPSLVYVFTEDESIKTAESIVDSLKRIGVSLPNFIYSININDLSSDDPDIKNLLWDKLRFLINYQTPKSKED